MNKISNDLSEKSASYYSESDVYHKFSQAEDYLNLVENYLRNEVKNKDVLDLGCGNGKYLSLLENYCQALYGLDLSSEQLALIHKKEIVICADASAIPLQSESLDLIYSCWMFGTILDEEKRLKAINEAKRVIKLGGKIILVENSEFSEFEKIRGRTQDPLKRTEKYNEWLFSQNFILKTQLDTYFKFPNEQEANTVFRQIWKDRFLGPVSSTIQHDISIMEWTKLS